MTAQAALAFVLGILTVVSLVSTGLLLLIRADLRRAIHAEMDPAIITLHKRIDKLVNDG